MYYFIAFSANYTCNAALHSSQSYIEELNALYVMWAGYISRHILYVSDYEMTRKFRHTSEG